jgi:ribosomal protein L13E
VTEVKEAGLTVDFARTIGISVDTSFFLTSVKKVAKFSIEFKKSFSLGG